MNSHAQIGIIGLGAMGKGLALNFAENGYRISVFNRHLDGVEENVAQDFMAKTEQRETMAGFDELDSFVQSLAAPRKILLLVSSGTAVDEVIENLKPFLKAGDLIIDGGNSHHRDTERRLQDLETMNIDYLGAGISGGPDGARQGPAIMVGGTGYKKVSDLLCSITAQDKSGEACCDYIGAGGAGHYVKMVHNGIEYAEIQMLAEVYQLLRYYCQMDPDEISSIFNTWQETDLASYLLRITAEILTQKDGDEPFIDKVLDNAEQKGTGSWCVASAMDLGVPSSTISEALMARYLSGMKDERIIAEKKYNLLRKTFSGDKQKFINSVRDGYRVARIINHDIGFHLLREARSAHEWQAGLSEIARIWTKGCIIQSQLMVELVVILESGNNVLLHDDIVGHLQSSTPALKQLVAAGLDAGYALPVFSAALNYYLGYTQGQSPANLIQAQRYHFGSHPFERID
jgi:6-phosphogluconate dehydrogenase